MKSIIYSLFFTLMLLMMACTPGLRSVVYNNTGQIVKLHLCRDTFVIPRHKSVEIFNVLCEDTPKLVINGKIYEYSHKFINFPIEEIYNEYLVRKVGEVVVRYQIDIEGLIYILSVKQNFPYREKGAQPKKFPLQPIIVD